MKTFDQFRNDWTGNRVNPDGVEGWQCVDLILQYIRECYGITGGVSGHAIHYWTQTSPPLLTKFHQESNNNAQKGDIVVLWGLPGNPYGHIGIATGGINNTQVEILEQNGLGGGTGTGRDAIGTRWVTRARVAGLLRPNVMPTPIQSPTPVPIQQTAGDSIHLPASVPSWAVYTPGSALRKGTSDQRGNLAPQKYGGLTYKIVDRVGDYAVIIDTESFGRVAIWTKGTDAQFVTTTQPAAPAPALAPPPPAAPITAKPAEKYLLDWEVPSYADPMDAQMNRNPTGKLTPNNYTVYDKNNKAYNLTLDNMKAGSWINIDDNVPPAPTPEPVHVEVVSAPATIPEIKQPPLTKPTRPSGIGEPHFFDHPPVYYDSLNNIPLDIEDMSGRINQLTGKPNFVTLAAFSKHIPMYCWYEIDGQMYLQTQQYYESNQYYLAPMNLFDLHKKPLGDQVIDMVHDLNLEDKFIHASARIKVFLDGIKSVMAGKSQRKDK